MGAGESTWRAVPDLIDAATAVKQRRERAQLLQAELAAEAGFIRRVAAAHRGGRLDDRGLLAASDQVRDWSQHGGTPGFSARWQQHIPLDRMAIRKWVQSIPPNGDAWTGSGWDSGEDVPLPPLRTHVVYALFDTGRPVHIGLTQVFTRQVNRLYRNGLRWQSWIAWPCDSRQDAVELRRQVVAKYGEPIPTTLAEPASHPRFRQSN